MKREDEHREDTLPIGKVAAQAGVNIQTLRYYERRGIIPAPKRTSSGYRAYTPETVSVIRFIKRAQELGFTLEEAEELVELRRLKGKSQSVVRKLAQNKLDAIDQKLGDLSAIRAAVAALVESCACSDGGSTCPILEALEQPSSIAAASARMNGRAKNMKTNTLTFSVDGMSCEGCASRIKSALARLDGVSHVDVDVAGKSVRVNSASNQLDADTIGETLRGLGYQVDVSAKS